MKSSDMLTSARLHYDDGMNTDDRNRMTAPYDHIMSDDPVITI